MGLVPPPAALVQNIPNQLQQGEMGFMRLFIQERPRNQILHHLRRLFSPVVPRGMSPETQVQRNQTSSSYGRAGQAVSIHPVAGVKLDV